MMRSHTMRSRGDDFLVVAGLCLRLASVARLRPAPPPVSFATTMSSAILNAALSTAASASAKMASSWRGCCRASSSYSFLSASSSAAPRG